MMESWVTNIFQLGRDRCGAANIKHREFRNYPQGSQAHIFIYVKLYCYPRFGWKIGQ